MSVERIIVHGSAIVVIFLFLRVFMLTDSEEEAEDG